MLFLSLHFLLGALGCLAVFLICTRISGARSFSAPFGLIFVGIACAVLALYLSPWTTPAIIAVYALVSAVEVRREFNDRKARGASREP